LAQKELSSQGHPQREIAQILQVSSGTVNRDLSYLRQQTKSNIRRYIDERLPEEYEKWSCWIYSNPKRSVEYLAAYRR
jgi:DeoR/GlpR family transcriptional regulator of sugar metabolism